MPKIFLSGVELTPEQIANHANAVHVIAGGSGNPFNEKMFTPHNGRFNVFRLSGNHCDCGCDKHAVGRPSRGEFELFPLYTSAVKMGGKAYMQCIKCGSFSHL